MNYNKQNTSYKFFTYLPKTDDGRDSHEFSIQKVKVTFDKDTKEIISFASKPLRPHATNYYCVEYRTTHKNLRFGERVVANKVKTVDRFAPYLQAMQDQNIVL